MRDPLRPLKCLTSFAGLRSRGKCGLWLHENRQVMLPFLGDVRELDDSDLPSFCLQAPLRKRATSAEVNSTAVPPPTQAVLTYT